MVVKLKHIAAFFRLLRYPNLLIIAATLYLIRYFIIFPVLEANGYTPQLSEKNFFLLTITTILIAAAGYVINDYFDRKTDIINRPDKVIIGKIIKRRAAIGIHIILSGIAVLLGFYISYSIGMIWMGIIFILITGILWFYSTTYKRQVFIGNLVVALLTALVPLMALLFEYPLLNRVYGSISQDMGSNFNYLAAWVFGFAAFAFLTNLSREIVKDIEDYEGDRIFGRETLPLVIGIKATRGLVIGLETIIILTLVYVYFFFLSDAITLIYFLTAIIGPSLVIIGIVSRARNKADYHKASNWIKITMLTGLLYALLANYIIQVKF